MPLSLLFLLAAFRHVSAACTNGTDSVMCSQMCAGTASAQDDERTASKYSNCTAQNLYDICRVYCTGQQKACAFWFGTLVNRWGPCRDLLACGGSKTAANMALGYQQCSANEIAHECSNCPTPAPSPPRSVPNDARSERTISMRFMILGAVFITVASN
mmetsp:Transcript_70009/g.135151  ORF Transcript_70009/g.135151 Transcript_70009/m.135151 type:complete len:158 (+) Transcript_70009:89-562(+)